MRLRLLIWFWITLIFAAACQGQPPTVVYIVLSPTPLEVASNIETGNSPALTEAPTHTPTPGPTATAAIFPTPTINQITVAEQVFEHGRMFWIEPTRQIWVLVIESEGRGVWKVYEDTFSEGEPEMDPSIVPPPNRLQPMRGFGKLWRENPEVKEALGWAVTPEFGYVSNYEYHPGGEVQDGEYVPGPGYHVLFSLYEEAFRFNEADGTWQLGL
jgi:hypothetical protein